MAKRAPASPKLGRATVTSWPRRAIAWVSAPRPSPMPPTDTTGASSGVTKRRSMAPTSVIREARGGRGPPLQAPRMASWLMRATCPAVGTCERRRRRGRRGYGWPGHREKWARAGGGEDWRDRCVGEMRKIEGGAARALDSLGFEGRGRCAGPRPEDRKDEGFVERELSGRRTASACFVSGSKRALWMVGGFLPGRLRCFDSGLVPRRVA